jgi:ribose/xylose/arabinose/galactoside ABC-type transport system permease subunit
MTAAISRFTARAFSAQKALLAIVMVVVAMALLNLNPATRTEFFTGYNLVDLLNSNSIYIILAMGSTVVLIAGGVDLSIGGVMSLTGIIAIQLINAGVPTVVAIAVCLAIGALVGVVNGFISVYQKIEPFIVTLGMGILLTGVGQQLTNARPVSAKDPTFVNIANLQVLGWVPTLVLVMVVVVAMTYWLLRNTAFGRNCYAVGGDYEVAKYSGIDVRRTKALTYVICGVTAALAGVMLSSQVNAGNSIFGDSTALYVVCAVVLGGTSVAGGIGGAGRSVVGVMLLGVLTNAFNMLRIDSLVPYLPQALLGLIIVSVLWLDSYGRKRRREAV